MSLAKPLTAQDLYASSALNPASLTIYHLGAQADNEHLLYTVSTVQHEPLLIRLYKNRDGLDLPSFLEQVWQQDEFLRKRFAQGLLVLDTEYWLVVPSEHVPDGQEADYLKAYYEIHASDAQVGYHFQKDILRGSGAAFLMAYDAQLIEYLHARHGQLGLNHASYRYVQISQHLAQAHLQHRPFRGLVWLHFGRFYYVLFQEDRLVFVNHFTAAVPEDVLYPLQSLHSLLGIDKSQVAVAVGGYSVLRPYVATLLYRFFGAGYRDLGRAFPAPSTMKEAGLAVEDVLPITLLGADSAG